MALGSILRHLALPRRQHNEGAVERRNIERGNAAIAVSAKAATSWRLSMNISVTAGAADDHFLNAFQRLAAALQRDRRLGVEISVGRDQHVLLPSAGRNRKTAAGKVEQRDIGAAGGLSELGDRFFKLVECEVFLDRYSEGDRLQARRNEFGVDRRFTSAASR